MPPTPAQLAKLGSLAAKLAKSKTAQTMLRGFQEGRAFTIGQDAGNVYGYGKSVALHRTPKELKEGLGALGNAARMAGRTTADAGGFMSQGIWYSLNHPQAMQSQINRVIGKRIGASADATNAITWGAGMTMAQLSGQHDITNPQGLFAPKGYAAIQPDENNPDKRQGNPISEIFFGRLQGRRGNLLPYEQYLRANGLTPEQFPYKEYKDLSRFQRGQKWSDAPVSVWQLNEDFGLGLSADQMKSKEEMPIETARRGMVALGMPAEFIDRFIAENSEDSEDGMMRMSFPKAQDESGVRMLGTKPDDNPLIRVANYSNNPAYPPGGAIRTFGVDTSVVGIGAAAAISGAGFAAVNKGNQKRFRELVGKVARSGGDDSNLGLNTTLSDTELKEYQRLKNAPINLSPEQKTQRKLDNQLAAIDQIKASREPDFPRSATIDPQQLGALSDSQIRNEARLRGLPVSASDSLQNVLQRIDRDNVSRGFGVPEKELSAFDEAFNQPPTASAPPVPKTTPKAVPNPKASSLNTAYDRAYSTVRSSNARTTDEIVGVLKKTGLSNDDLTLKAIAGQFQQRMSKDAGGGGDVMFRQQQPMDSPMPAFSQRQGLKERGRNALQGMRMSKGGDVGGVPTSKPLAIAPESTTIKLQPTAGIPDDAEMERLFKSMDDLSEGMHQNLKSAGKEIFKASLTQAEMYQQQLQDLNAQGAQVDLEGAAGKSKAALRQQAEAMTQLGYSPQEMKDFASELRQGGESSSQKPSHPLAIAPESTTIKTSKALTKREQLQALTAAQNLDYSVQRSPGTQVIAIQNPNGSGATYGSMRDALADLGGSKGAKMTFQPRSKQAASVESALGVRRTLPPDQITPPVQRQRLVEGFKGVLGKTYDPSPVVGLLKAQEMGDTTTAAAYQQKLQSDRKLARMTGDDVGYAKATRELQSLSRPAPLPSVIPQASDRQFQDSAPKPGSANYERNYDRIQNGKQFEAFRQGQRDFTSAQRELRRVPPNLQSGEAIARGNLNNAQFGQAFGANKSMQGVGAIDAPMGAATRPPSIPKAPMPTEGFERVNAGLMQQIQRTNQLGTQQLASIADQMQSYGAIDNTPARAQKLPRVPNAPKPFTTQQSQLEGALRRSPTVPNTTGELLKRNLPALYKPPVTAVTPFQRNLPAVYKPQSTAMTKPPAPPPSANPQRKIPKSAIYNYPAVESMNPNRIPRSLRTPEPAPSRIPAAPKPPVPTPKKQNPVAKALAPVTRAIAPIVKPLNTPIKGTPKLPLGKILGPAGAALDFSLEYAQATEQGESNKKSVARGVTAAAISLPKAGLQGVSGMTTTLMGVPGLVKAIATGKEKDFKKYQNEQRTTQAGTDDFYNNAAKGIVEGVQGIGRAVSQFVNPQPKKPVKQAPATGFGAGANSLANVGKMMGQAKPPVQSNYQKLQTAIQADQAKRDAAKKAAVDRVRPQIAKQKAEGWGSGADFLAHGLLKGTGGAQGLRDRVARAQGKPLQPRANQGAKGASQPSQAAIARAMAKSPYSKPGARINQSYGDDDGYGPGKPVNGLKESKAAAPAAENLTPKQKIQQMRDQASMQREGTRQSGNDGRTQQNNARAREVAAQNNARAREVAGMNNTRARDVAAQNNARAREVAGMNNTRARDVAAQNNARAREVVKYKANADYRRDDLTSGRKLQGDVYKANTDYRGKIDTQVLKGRSDEKVAKINAQGKVQQATIEGGFKLQAEGIQGKAKTDSEYIKGDFKVRSEYIKGGAKVESETVRASGRVSEAGLKAAGQVGAAQAKAKGDEEAVAYKSLGQRLSSLNKIHSTSYNARYW